MTTTDKEILFTFVDIIICNKEKCQDFIKNKVIKKIKEKLFTKIKRYLKVFN